jgi:hypothetical protein
MRKELSSTQETQNYLTNQSIRKYNVNKAGAIFSLKLEGKEAELAIIRKSGGI